jgi:methyltransferase (TIGR00027 family)
VLADTIGLQIVAPPGDWRERGDMNPQGTARFRASIVARARFVEDLVAEEVRAGIGQYVILGAGLDTYAQRNADSTARLRVFEVDQPDAQAWKRDRLVELGLPTPSWLSFVPIYFESEWSWADLVAAGFDPNERAIVSSMGVSMYLTREAIAESLRRVASLASGSKLVMTFLLPFEFLDERDRPLLEAAERGARASGTPFLSLLAPDEINELVRASGFRKVEQVSTADLGERYFQGRSDGLESATGEVIVVATN